MMLTIAWGDGLTVASVAVFTLCLLAGFRAGGGRR